MKSFFGNEDKRFRALVENVLDVITVLSLDGTFVYCSPSVTVTLGYEPDELVGRNAFGMLHPADLPRATKLFAQILLHPGESFSALLRYRHKNGEWLWLEGIAVNRLSDVDIQGVVVNFRDVTQRVDEEERTQQRAEQMSAMYKTAQELVVERNPQRLLNVIVERAVSLLEADAGGLYLCEPEKDQVRCVVSYQTRGDYTGTILKYGEGAAGLVAKTGEPLIVDDYRVWEGRSRIFDGNQPFTAILSVPMKYQDEMIGVLHILDNHETRKFDETDLKTASIFANQASIAVANARLIEEVQQRSADLEKRSNELAHSNDLLASLHSIAAGMMVSREGGEILRILSEELKRLGFGHEITLYDAETDELVVETLSVDSQIMQSIEKLIRLPVKGFRISAKSPVLVELLESDSARYLDESKSITLSISYGLPKLLIEKAYDLIVGKTPLPAIILPLRVGDRKIGLMGIWGRHLKPEDVDIFVAFTAQVAIALDNSRLLETERQRALELFRSNTLLASLHSIAAGTMVSQGSDAILNVISMELDRLGIGHGITLYDPETDELISQYVSVDPVIMKRLEKLLGRKARELRVGHQIKGARTPASIPFLAELLETGSARYMDDFLTAIIDSSIPLKIPKQLLPKAMEIVMGASSIPLILLPLKVRERKLGLMAVWGRDLKPEDVGIFVAFTAQVAIALENSRLMDLERHRAAELEDKVSERTRQLGALLQEKEVLLREVYHRVKNNLQVISSLLGLQAPRLETQSDRQLVVDTRERVRAMALVHEKLYQSDDLARVDFSEYIQSLVGNLARIYLRDPGEVDVVIRVEKTWLGLDTAVPCGLIVNELVANAFKHAFQVSDVKQKARIMIELRSTKGDMC